MNQRITSIEKFILRNIVYCFQNKFPLQTFLWRYLISQISRDCLWWNHFLIKMQPRTLPNFIIDLFKRVFWNSCTKTLENIQKNVAYCTSDTFQFVILNPWKVPWNWIAFYQNSFGISPGCYISWLDPTLEDL